MKYKDYYETLGVAKDADAKAIKSAYRKLAKKYHPDLNQGNEEAANKLKEINEAYEVLSDEDKRKKYDQFGSNYDFSGGQNFDPSNFGYGPGTYTYTSGEGDFSDFFNMIFGNDPRMGGGARSSTNFSGFNIGDLFGNKQEKRKAKARYDLNISLGLEEAFKGGEKDINVSLNGQPKTIRVKWPKGITNGKKIKINGSKYGIDGDLVAKVTIVTNDTLDGNDIIKKQDVFPWEAYFGTEKKVKTLNGTIKIKIPEGLQTGKKIKVPKKGFVDMKGNTGDLYIEINIVNPSILTDEQKELYKKLEEISK